VNRNWNEDPFDRVLREAMHSRPEHPPIENLTWRAVQRARRQSVAHVRLEQASCYARWHRLVSLATTLILGVTLWFVASRITLPNDDGLSTTVTAVSEGAGVAQQLNAEEVTLVAVGILLLVGVGIIVQHALSCEQYSLATSGSGDLFS
jgi:hypothetical protein